MALIQDIINCWEGYGNIMLDLYGIEDVIDGCAYLVACNNLYEYIGHDINGDMVFRNTNRSEQPIVISWDELIKQKDKFEIAY